MKAIIAGKGIVNESERLIFPYQRERLNGSLDRVGSKEK